MAAKKTPTPAIPTVEVASMAITVQALVRNPEGLVQGGKTAEMTVMAAEFATHTFLGIAEEVKRQLTEQLLKGEG